MLEPFRLCLHLALTCDHHDPIKQIVSSVNQNTARLHLASSADFSIWITDRACLYLNKSVENGPVQSQPEMVGFLLKSIFSSRTFYKSKIRVGDSLVLHTGVLCLFF